MKRAASVAQAVWSSASMLVTVGMFALFIFWTVVQQPLLTYRAEGMKLEYSASPGSTIYMENPIFPPNSDVQIRLIVKLESTTGGESYRLTPSDSTHMFPHNGEKEFKHIRAGYPVYAVQIPGYVKPDKYQYKVTAKYKLNLFRVERMKLPAVTIVVK